MNAELMIGIHGCDHTYRVEVDGVDPKDVGEGGKVQQVAIDAVTEWHAKEHPTCPATLASKASQN